MGCDIHLFLERKNNDGSWYDANIYRRNDYKTMNQEENTEPDFKRLDFYYGRNYDLFAILAGVRNYGFIKPISQPKGLPVNASKEVKDELRKCGDAAHSVSYLTLLELLEARPIYQEIKCSGFIKAEDAQLLDEKGIIPKEYSQGVFGKGTENRYVKREWIEKSDLLGGFINKILASLETTYLYWEKERMIEHAEKIRVIFWFDN